jgi:hypothetical protein
MKELKLSLADRLASQAIRKAAAERLIEYGKRLREPGAPQIAEAELESELKAVRAEVRETRNGGLRGQAARGPQACALTRIGRPPT